MPQAPTKNSLLGREKRFFAKPPVPLNMLMASFLPESQTSPMHSALGDRMHIDIGVCFEAEKLSLRDGIHITFVDKCRATDC